MGIAAMVVYIMFLVHPLKRLRLIENESYEHPDRSKFYYLSVGLQASLVGFMVSSFFGAVAYHWYVYYLVGYAVCLHRLYIIKFPPQDRSASESMGAPVRKAEDRAGWREPASNMSCTERCIPPAVAGGSAIACRIDIEFGRLTTR